MRTDPLVVTGAGVLCPIAGDVASFARAARERGPRATRISFDLTDRLTPNQARRLDRLSQLLVIAAAEALQSAGLAGAAGERIGFVAGTALGCLEKTGEQLRGIARAGLDHADPLGFPDSMDNAPASHATLALGCRGPSLTVMEREVTGECATILAAVLLRTGAADVVVVAAGDAAGPELEELPTRRLVPGEGAGALVLETERSATMRGAPVLGRLLGYAQANAEGRTGPLRPAPPEVVARAGERALAMAGVAGQDVSVVGELALRERMGWCMADGILRSILGLTRFAVDPRAVLVARGARGGSAAALVLGAPERPA